MGKERKRKKQNTEEHGSTLVSHWMAELLSVFLKLSCMYGLFQEPRSSGCDPCSNKVRPLQRYKISGYDQFLMYHPKLRKSGTIYGFTSKNDLYMCIFSSHID